MRPAHSRCSRAATSRPRRHTSSRAIRAAASAGATSPISRSISRSRRRSRRRATLAAVALRAVPGRLKRCETQFSESLWFNRRGKLEAITCDFLMNGGGKKNLSYVAQLAALSAMSCYEIPRARAQAASTYTREVFGGSQRGFGGPQAFMAVETLMDEAARRLASPFAIRRANFLGGTPARQGARSRCADPVRPAARRVARPARTAPRGANGSAPRGTRCAPSPLRRRTRDGERGLRHLR